MMQGPRAISDLRGIFLGQERSWGGYVFGRGGASEMRRRLLNELDDMIISNGGMISLTRDNILKVVNF